MNQQEMTTIIAMTSCEWTNWRPQAADSPEGAKILIETWMELLGDLDFELVKLAWRACAMDKPTFAPNAGELREQAIRLAEPNPPPEPDEAWTEVKDRIHYVGHHGCPTWTHPLVEQAVETMGWWDLCMSENVMADRAHFINQLYRPALERWWQERRRPQSFRDQLEAYKTRQAIPSADQMVRELSASESFVAPKS